MNELERIVQRTRSELGRRVTARPLPEVRRAAQARLQRDPPRGFAAALAAPGLSVIAEHKRRSPSAGVIREDLSLEEVVGAYARGGARALSVLTEREGFGGALDDLGRARRAASLPILRKDFMVTEYQIVEAFAGGADAVLLIVAALAPAELAALYAIATGFGLDTLVEVHDERELEVALQSIRPGPAIIGINNRDLATMQVDLERTYELLPGVPAGTITVAESGLRTAADLQRVADAGIDAVLVGESLMRAPDIEQALVTLLR